MSDPLLRRLAELDPAAGLDPSPDDALLARALAAPRAGRPNQQTRLAPRLAFVAAVAALTAVLVPVLRSDEQAKRAAPPALGDLELASRAYRRTNPQPGKILHTVVTYVGLREYVETGRVKVETRGRTEQWHRGTESHTLNRYGGAASGLRGQALDHLVSGGMMRQVDSRGGYRVVRAEDNGDSARAIREEQRGFIDEFRRDYEGGDLLPGGDVTFAGRPAQRYTRTQIVRARDQDGKLLKKTFEGPTTTYYIDRETGDPLGSTSDDGPGQMQLPGGKTVNLTSKRIVREIEWLPPTRANLADLREFVLQRRRDANGCIRGASRKRRPAPVLECGGRPGASIPTS